MAEQGRSERLKEFMYETTDVPGDVQGIMQQYSKTPEEWDILDRALIWILAHPGSSVTVRYVFENMKYGEMEYQYYVQHDEKDCEACGGRRVCFTLLFDAGLVPETTTLCTISDVINFFTAGRISLIHMFYGDGTGEILFRNRLLGQEYLPYYNAFTQERGKAESGMPEGF